MIPSDLGRFELLLMSGTTVNEDDFEFMGDYEDYYEIDGEPEVNMAPSFNSSLSTVYSKLETMQFTDLHDACEMWYPLHIEPRPGAKDTNYPCQFNGKPFNCHSDLMRFLSENQYETAWVRAVYNYMTCFYNGSDDKEQLLS